MGAGDATTGGTTDAAGTGVSAAGGPLGGRDELAP